MNAVETLAKHAAPGGRPQPLAFHDGMLWVGCWDEARLYALDPASWTVREDVALPGKPYGIAPFEGALRIVIPLGDDDRYLYRFVPGRPLDEANRVACPQLTGSHLAANGSSLYLVQQSNRRIVQIDAKGESAREIPLATRCGGLGFANGRAYVLAADADFDVVEFASLDLDAQAPTPTTLAPMDVEARALAYDGTAWWTSHRETNEIVRFRVEPPRS